MLVEAEVIMLAEEEEDEDADIEEDAEADEVELVFVTLYGFDVLDMLVTEDDVTVAQLPVDDELTEIEVEEELAIEGPDEPPVVVVVFVEDGLVPR
jgi:hypothetical protein